MEVQKTQKIQSWKKSDYGINIIVFLANILIICGILLVTVWINGVKFDEAPQFDEYLTSYLGQFLYLILIVALICSVFFIYMYYEDRDLIKNPRNIQMIFGIIELSLIVCYFSGAFVNIYFRPLALGALLSLQLINRRGAVLINTVICLIIFLMDVFTNLPIDTMDGALHAQYSALVIGFTSGTIGIYLINGVTSRVGVLLKGLWICLPVLICIILLEQMNLLEHWEMIISAFSSGILSVVLFILFLPIFEGMFNKITTYRLSELTDHNSPLLSRLRSEAPGTFNHSVALATIAESCADAIGEDPILARACAYYHDMGKLKQPEFFKENQADGTNPHDGLTPELSINIIRSHTKDGAEIIKKYRLPQIFADVCMEHHGTMPIMYFYAKAGKFTEGKLNIEDYSYLGPKPQTKIAAIIMIADSAEAAVRAGKDRSREKVAEVVNKIIQDRLNLHQFNECEITLKELNIISNACTNTLTGVYHSRIEYPKVNLDNISGESY